MRVFIIDTGDMVSELHGELLGVEGSYNPTAAEKQECVETVSQYAMDGWAIAADPNTPIGRLAALTAETALRAIRQPDLTRRVRTAPKRTGLAPSGIRPESLPGAGSNECRFCASKPARKHNV